MGSPERRVAVRIRVDAAHAALELPSRHVAPILDVGAGGLRVQMTSEEVRELGATRANNVRVMLAEYPAFETRVVPVTSAGSAPGVGVRFIQLDETAMASLAQFVVTGYLEQMRPGPREHRDADRTLRVADPRRVAHIFKRAGQDKAPLYGYRHAGGHPTQFTITQLQRAPGSVHAVLHAHDPASATRLLGLRLLFQFSVVNALHTFEGELRPALGIPGVFHLNLPTVLEKGGFRESIRARPESPLTLSLLHPRLRGKTLSKRALDISSRGVSFFLDPHHDCLFPGERLVVEFGNGWLWAEAELRGLTRTPDGGLICGAKLTRFPGRLDATRWRNYVFENSFPGLRVGRADAVDDAWSVLEGSKYIGGETSEVLHSTLKRHYLIAWKRYAEKHRFGSFFVAYRQGKAVGTSAATLLYPGSWLLHHFGIDEKRRRASKRFLYEVAREIYGGIFHLAQQLEQFEHFVVYADSGKAWNRLMYGRFLAGYPNVNDYVYDTRAVFKAQPGSLENRRPPVPQGVQVVPSSQSAVLLNLLANRLSSTLPAVELDALYLRRDNLDLATFSEYCAARRYVRQRRIWFGMVDGLPATALIAELGDEAANVFNLLNRCWIIPLQDRPTTSSLEAGDAIERLLLWHALRFYQERGASEALLLAPENKSSVAALQMGFVAQAVGLRFLGRRALVPAWMNYIDDFLGALQR